MENAIALHAAACYYAFHSTFFLGFQIKSFITFMDKLNLKVPPVVVFLVCLSLLILFDNYLPGISFPGIPWWIITIPVMVGLVVALTGVIQFSMRSTTVNPHRPGNTTTLVTDGIYRFTRNPMYLGLLLLMVAAVLKLGNIFGILIVAIFILYMNRFQIRPEEQAMEEKFGDAYRNYKQDVRRWI
jgi:protein-S-isoprenylcysteine O-methyltransferase Ste14